MSIDHCTEHKHDSNQHRSKFYPGAGGSPSLEASAEKTGWREVHRDAGQGSSRLHFLRPHCTFPPNPRKFTLPPKQNRARACTIFGSDGRRAPRRRPRPETAHRRIEASGFAFERRGDRRSAETLHSRGTSVKSDSGGKWKEGMRTSRRNNEETRRFSYLIRTETEG